MTELHQKRCEPCTTGVPPLTAVEAQAFLRVTPGWTLEGNAIARDFEFRDFRGAMAFVNRVAELAEEEGHHPDISVFYSRVRLLLYTHKINGLSESDFVLAAKVNRLLES